MGCETSYTAAAPRPHEGREDEAVKPTNLVDSAPIQE